MSDPKFDHLVVVMMENRSFDQMLGNLYTKDDPPPRRQTFDGIDGKELFNPSSTDSTGVVRVGPAMHWDGVQGDPNHDFNNVQWQLFWKQGDTIPIAPATETLLPLIPNPPVAAMQGFVADYENVVLIGNSNPPKYKYSLGDVMSYFPTHVGGKKPGLKVLPTLARAFAVSDAWFASVPTQTLPNRSFCNAGTSNGFVWNSDDWLLNKNGTIFTALGRSREVKRSGIWPWRIYHDHLDDESAESLTVYIHWPELKNYRKDKNYRRSVDRFVKDACEGDLPAYSFIEPRITGYYKPEWRPKNDQHPDQDIRYGENFINRVYSAVATSPLRDRILLVITYDEHGGIYDHVSPPYGVPPPIRKGSGFGFTRLGVRVPAVIVSPFIRRGTVYHPRRKYIDHTAIIKTLVNRWERKSLPVLAPFGPRAAFAPDLSELLTLRRPRPRRDFPDITPWEVAQDLRPPETIPANDLQRDFVQLVARAHGLPAPPPPRTEAEVIAFFRAVPREKPT